MKLQYASDLHLEFSANSSYLKLEPLTVSGDVLVLAGDIGYLGDDNSDKHPLWDWASANYRQVVVIPGNHEFYKLFNIDGLYNGWTYPIRPNISYYYNTVISLDNDIDLIATTLWGHIDIRDAFRTEVVVNDFKRICSGSKPLSWMRFNREHVRCFRFLTDSVKLSKAKHIVVVTHHVPSFELMAEEFKGSVLNGAFTVELGDYIANSPIEYWIYGHSHRNVNKVIGKTQCLSNQLGYVFQNEHQSFSRNSYIEIRQ